MTAKMTWTSEKAKADSKSTKNTRKGFKDFNSRENNTSENTTKTASDKAKEKPRWLLVWNSSPALKEIVAETHITQGMAQSTEL